MCKSSVVYPKQLFFLPIYILLFAACNNSNEQLPPGTNVSIAPSKFTWTVTEVLDSQGNCVFYSDDYQDNIMVVTVSDQERRPIGEIKLQLYLSPSNSTSNPALNDQHVFYLYDDLNSNGVADHPAELVSGSGDPILYETETEKYHGTKTVIVRTNTSCGGYLATLHAYAGDGYGAMEINTESENDDQTAETEQQE
ncbi:MAG: hypothetical protein AB2598_09375 [Candidatus Thiodiazotropha sp.]